MGKDETILVEIDINSEPSEKKTKRLRGELDLLKASKADLIKVNKAGKLAQQEYADALDSVDKQLKQTNAELKIASRTLELETKIQQSATDSMDRQRALAALLTLQYTALSKEQRETTESGLALGRQIRDINAELRTNEKAIGDNRRSIGDYASATAETNKKLDEMNDRQKKVGQSLATLDDSFGAFGGQLSSWKQQLQGTKAGLEATKLGLTGLKGAIAATGIGLLLVALGALYTLLTRTQGGMDFVERKTAAVGKVFQFLTGGVVGAGRALIAAFENPKQTLIELGNLIKEQVINRFRAFSVIAQAVANRDLKGMTNGFIQLNTGVENGVDKLQKFGKGLSDAAKAGDALARTTIAIRREESSLNAERAQSRAEVERFKKLGEDTTKDLKTRQAAFRQAYALENGLLQKQLQLQDRKVTAIKEEYKGRMDLEGAQHALNEALAERGDLEEDSLGKQTELQNSLNAAAQEAADKSKQARDAAKQAALERLQLLQQVADKRVEIAQLRGQDTTELEVAAIRAAANVELAQAGTNAKLRTLIELETAEKILRVRVEKEAELAAATLATRRAGLTAQLALAVEGSSTQLRLQLASIQATADAEKAELERSAARTREGRQLLAAELLRVDAQTRAATEAANKAFADRRQEQLQQATDRELALRAKLATRFKADLDKAAAARRDRTEADLAEAKAGSRQELTARVEAIKNERDEELRQEGLTVDAIRAIRTRAAKAIAQEEEGFLLVRIGRVLEGLGQISSIYTQLVQNEMAAQSKALDDQQKRALGSALLSADQRAAIEKDFQAKRARLEVEAAKKRKQIATVENLINTAKAITAALPNIPLAVLAAAVGAAQQIVIESQQFARGGVDRDYKRQRPGIVRGPGTTTSDSIAARLSRDESVINAISTRKHYNLLSAINQDGGGVAFPGADTRNLLSDVQAYRSSVRAQGGNASNDSYFTTADALRQISAVQPTSAPLDPALMADLIEVGVSRALERMPAPRLVVSDYERSAKRVRTIQTDADV